MWRRLQTLQRLTHRYHGTPFQRQRGSNNCNYGNRALSSKPESGVPYKTLKSDKKTAPKVIPQEADVVIIGGGSIGCSTLYHLTKLGITNAVLLERDQLTAGTTWHTAGLVWRLRPSDIEVELLNYMRHLVRDVLEEETGVVPGWIENGGLFIASTKERLDEYKRLGTIGKVYGVESYVLSPKETKDLYPLMNVDDLYGTLYSPGDGVIDPAGYCTALSRAATRAGAKVITDCPVTGIQVGVDDFGVKRVQGVETEFGSIKAPIVVNCSGVWSPHIGKMADVSVPLVAMHHAYVVTERIEGIQNMPNVRDHDASVYLKLQGDALSVGGYESNPVFWDDVKNDFAFSLFELDWDIFSQHVEGAVNRVPVIGQTGVKSTVCGPESFTPDHKPLMGESPELRGFYLGCGYNSSGMMLGGGCGKELAHWVVHGRPELDMYSYDIRRFSQGMVRNSRWLKETSHEAYAKNYSMVFPHDEQLAGRNIRKDVLHQILEDAGCHFQTRLGWERPGYFLTTGTAPVKDYDYYGSYDHPQHEMYEYGQRLEDDYSFDFPKHHDLIENECLTCRNGVAAFNMSYFGKYYLTGPDAQRAADWIFSNDVQKPEGSTVYTCILNKAGGVESDLTVSTIAPGDGATSVTPNLTVEAFISQQQASVPNILRLISRLPLKTRGLTVNYKTLQRTFVYSVFKDQREPIHLQIAIFLSSRDVLQALTSSDLSNDSFPFGTSQVVQLAGHTLRAIRLTFVGELGWELHIPKDSTVDVYHAVMKAGAAHGIINAGYRAIDSLSVEKGYRHWHTSLRSNDTALEAGLGFTCKMKTDVPFLGREATAKQKEEGVKNKLACFTIDDHVPLLGLEAIRRNGELVGFLRQGEYGFQIKKSIGYGYVKHPQGQRLPTNS
ncbi:Sarcosine dehydrogenase, mitochondrial [Apostichopus japonicus]|uniref:Sarcosine dehydrogenase, mitochondrial n=1 Tax=Stichopus japonicus TaxID=307972 RepID=A0A2G8LAI5_STIJA|nr:Sarcosine dehydrogenase, mitochondrial [Apostichopus japonicus]